MFLVPSGFVLEVVQHQAPTKIVDVNMITITISVFIVQDFSIYDLPLRDFCCWKNISWIKASFRNKLLGEDQWLNILNTRSLCSTYLTQFLLNPCNSHWDSLHHFILCALNYTVSFKWRLEGITAPHLHLW